MLGGGFGGLAAAHELCRRLPPEDANFRAKQQWEQERLATWLD